ncbi:uncharacterized protein LOC141904942 [Tubulanus polymorphus]|uniref:uncharacterized protein LOC141904942 n=1 Tax=Tubulanus polymorphus TaxID=672921 RepID=UPI003DA5F0FC
MSSEIDPALRGSVDHDFFESPRTSKVVTAKKIDDTSDILQEHSDDAAAEKSNPEDNDDKTETVMTDSVKSEQQSKIIGNTDKDDKGSMNNRIDSETDELSGDDDGGKRQKRSRSSNSSRSSSRSSSSSSGGDSRSSSSRSSSASSRSRSRSRDSSPSAVKSQSDSSPEHSAPSKKSSRSGSDEPIVQIPTVSNEEIDEEKSTKDDYDYSGSSSASDHSGSELSDDSDMTDVSPLASPNRSPTTSPDRAAKKNGTRERKNSLDKKPPKSPVTHKDFVQYQKKLPNGKNVEEIEKEKMDLQVLMEAVLELDKERVQNPNRRVLFIPEKQRKKSNYSFSRGRELEIERENERLLHRLTPKKPRASSAKNPSFKRLSHSAINRQREQKKIEEENLKFLNRLQKVKPTKEISRERMLRDYHDRMTYGLPFPIYQQDGTDTDRENTLLLSDKNRTRSVCSINSNVSSARSRRPVSAKPRVDRRPVWSDRW